MQASKLKSIERKQRLSKLSEWDPNTVITEENEFE
jgi:hypothetical protein